jgi:hypothetical protein
MNWLRRKIEHNRARQLADSVTTWQRTCSGAAAICTEALYNEAVLQNDIGVVLDRLDRQLFQLRSQTGEARAAVRRQDECLAKRIDQLAKDIFELRNTTVRYLIRAQGPGPFVKVGADEERRRGEYALKALREAGYQARVQKLRVEQELAALWGELQPLVADAEKTITETN